MELSHDQLEASWLGGSSSHWATFAADRVFHKKTQYYTEIEILSLGRHKGKLAIGVVGCTELSPNKMEWQNSKGPVGEWRGPSWSFLPFSGLLKSHTIRSEGVPYGKDLTIQASDRIGVLVDLVEGKLIYFCNGNDLGVAFDDLMGQSLLLAISIRDKIKVRLQFPPPPYTKRTIKLIQLKSNS